MLQYQDNYFATYLKFFWKIFKLKLIDIKGPPKGYRAGV